MPPLHNGKMSVDLLNHRYDIIRDRARVNLPFVDAISSRVSAPLDNNLL